MPGVIHNAEGDFSDASKIITFNLVGRELVCYFYPVNQLPCSPIGKLKEFYEIWDNVRREKLPAWKDFNFEMFSGWHSVMRVMKTGGSMEAPKTNVIMGETFATYWGTKTFRAEIEEGLIRDPDIIRSYQEYHHLLHNGYYVFNTGTFRSVENKLKSMTMIDLPLSDNGTDVSHIMGALVENQ